MFAGVLDNTGAGSGRQLNYKSASDYKLGMYS